MKCHYETHEGKRVFIPGCYPGAVYGDQCICKTSLEKGKIDDLERRLHKLEKVVLKR